MKASKEAKVVAFWALSSKVAKSMAKNHPNRGEKL